MVIGIGEDIKRYRVYLLKEKKDIVTKHVKNILDKTQNEQVQRLYLSEEADAAEKEPARESARSAEAKNAGESPVTSIRANSGRYAPRSKKKKNLDKGVTSDMVGGASKTGRLALEVSRPQTAWPLGGYLLGIRELLRELGVLCVRQFELRIDNRAALAQLEGGKASSKAKPIEVRIKFVVFYTKEGVLWPWYWERKDMSADVFTR
ncbi:hypothetical protein PC128_g24313 [Phytophthora cactorum]|nr:hypothetical protein PC128_g24313 [Phytophthora cactorum]